MDYTTDYSSFPVHSAIIDFIVHFNEEIPSDLSSYLWAVMLCNVNLMWAEGVGQDGSETTSLGPVLPLVEPLSACCLHR